MNEPSTEFLLLLAKALQEARHKNVAEHLCAGLLWAMYPEWFDSHKDNWFIKAIPQERSRWR